MTRLIIVIFLCLTLLSCSRRQTIIIDDSVQSQQQFDRLDSSEIFSCTRWLPGEAPPAYQQWNKYLVIVVKTKKVEGKLQDERHMLLNSLLDSAAKGADILMVLNGILLPSSSQVELRKLSSDQLSNTKIMVFQAARNLYGTPARPITLVINTYDPNYNYNQ